MESAALTSTANDVQPDIKGNGNLKRKHGADGSSDDENDFLGFDLGEWRRKIQRAVQGDLIEIFLPYFHFSGAKR